MHGVLKPVRKGDPARSQINLKVGKNKKKCRKLTQTTLTTSEEENDHIITTKRTNYIVIMLQSTWV